MDDMLRKDVIRPTSLWTSHRLIVLVQKKDGSLRFCIDYHNLNVVTLKEVYPLSQVDDMLDTLAGSEYFTTLDLISGYWHVGVSSGDVAKTAFCTPGRLFEFNIMPFGLCNAPTTFQWLMDTVLAGLQRSNCLVYLDNIVIPGKSFEEHLHNLQSVFECLRQVGLKLNPDKCAFGWEQVTFIGHIVSKNGVATGPSKTTKVATWPVPTTPCNMQQFLGLASYYRRYVALTILSTT